MFLLESCLQVCLISRVVMNQKTFLEILEKYGFSSRNLYVRDETGLIYTRMPNLIILFVYVFKIN